MENTLSPLEKVIEKLEAYSKTSLTLYKYNALYTSADMFSVLAAKLVITLIITVSLLFASIGLALWIGEIIGQVYYGFFIVALAGILLAFLFYIFQNRWIKLPTSNFIISKILKKN